MSWVRNLLISIGAYWLSDYPGVLMSWVFAKVSNGITYGDSVVAAIAMGIMESMGPAVCAAFGGTIVTLSATGAKPQRWALIVAMLYVIGSSPRFHWYRPPTTWDRIAQVTGLAWPAVACIAAATLIAHMRRNSPITTSNLGQI